MGLKQSPFGSNQTYNSNNTNQLEKGQFPLRVGFTCYQPSMGTCGAVHHRNASIQVGGWVARFGKGGNQNRYEPVPLVSVAHMRLHASADSTPEATSAHVLFGSFGERGTGQSYVESYPETLNHLCGVGGGGEGEGEGEGGGLGGPTTTVAEMHFWPLAACEYAVG